MITYNVGFINTDGKQDETQLDIEGHNRTDMEIIELINLILSLKDEIGIKEITYIEHLECKNQEECPYDGMTIQCPDCGEDILIEYNAARCESCGWMAADAELEDVMEK